MNESLKHRVYPILNIAGYSEVNSTVLFYNFINSRLSDGSVVLDFGAGRGSMCEDASPWKRKLAATDCHRIKRIAVDVDPAVLQNPFATEHHVMALDDGRARIPLADSTVDVVICDWVVEHLPEPIETLREIARVLRPGGTVAIRTSNQWHYSYIAARLLGEGKLAACVLRWAQPGRKEEDVFPKLYRANTIRALRRALADAGLPKSAVFTWDSDPAYLGRSFLIGLIGFMYHRVAMLGLLPRACLFGFAVKEASAKDDQGRS